MVTNLPQQAKIKWNEVTLTKNPEERLRLMGEFMSLVPKHKGTEKLQRQVKRQMAQLREDIEKKKKQAKRSGGPSYYIQKAGAAQVAIIGPANAGRSSLLRAVTNSTVEITSWPFGTNKPWTPLQSHADRKIAGTFVVGFHHASIPRCPPAGYLITNGKGPGAYPRSPARYRHRFGIYRHRGIQEWRAGHHH